MLYRKISKKDLLIYLHGYRGNQYEQSFLADLVTKKFGYSFLSITYGARDRNGAIISLVQARKDLRQQITDFLITEQFENYYLVGYSLGGALSTELAADNFLFFKKIILLSIFDDRKQLLQQKNLYIPEAENISPINLVNSINPEAKLFFIHGKFDKAISIDRAFSVYKKVVSRNAVFIALPIGHNLRDTDDGKILLTILNDILLSGANQTDC
jgi:pimeloyl-ACP methyl ester carboxylesterase